MDCERDHNRLHPYLRGGTWRSRLYRRSHVCQRREHAGWLKSTRRQRSQHLSTDYDLPLHYDVQSHNPAQFRRLSASLLVREEVPALGP